MLPAWKTGMREVAPKVFAYVQATGETGISNAGLVVGADGAADRVLAFEAEVIVPGHGPIGTP